MISSTCVSVNVPGAMTIGNPFKARWPNPQASICSSSQGTDLVRGKLHWSAQGPALWAYNTIKDKIKHCLEDRGNDLYDSHANESSVPHSIYCLMVGFTVARARPYVVIACSQSRFSKNAMKVIKDTAWWKAFVGEQPGFGGFLLLQLAPRRMGDVDKTTPSFTSLVYTSDQLSSLYDMPIFFTAEQLGPHDACAWQQATFGNTIYLDDMPFGLTVAHPLAKQHGDISEEYTQHTDAVVYMDDSGDEYYTVDEDDSGDEFSSNLESRLGSFRDRAQSAPIRQDARIVQSQPLPNPPSLVGQLVCGSEGTPSDVADWALIALNPSYFRSLEASTNSPEESTAQRPPKPQQPSSRKVKKSTAQRTPSPQELSLGKDIPPARRRLSTTLDRNPFSDRYEFLPFGKPQIALNSVGDVTSVLLPNGKHDFSEGFLNANESLVCLAGTRQYLSLRSVVLQEDLLPGTCGRWVFDSDGNWYGHIVAGLPGTRTAYIACASQVFSDIERRTGITPSIYPGPESQVIADDIKEFTRGQSDGSGGLYSSTLRAASARGLEGVVRILLDAGADVNAGSPLFAASKGGHEKVVQILLDAGADVNAGALHKAAARGHYGVVQILLNAGADVNAGSPLFTASRGGHEKVVQILLDAGADIKVSDALFAASRGGHEKVVQILLNAGADIKVSGALFAASRGGHEKVLQILLDAGADIKVSGPLFTASGGGHEKVVQILLNARADVNTSDLLSIASRGGHEKVVQMLLDAGADVNAGYPLRTASIGGHEKMVQMLLDAGADVNACKRDSGSALQVASERGHEKVVQILLDAGADITAAAEHVAWSNRREKVVQMLSDAKMKRLQL